MKSAGWTYYGCRYCQFRYGKFQTQHWDVYEMLLRKQLYECGKCASRHEVRQLWQKEGRNNGNGSRRMNLGQNLRFQKDVSTKSFSTLNTHE